MREDPRRGACAVARRRGVGDTPGARSSRRPLDSACAGDLHHSTHIFQRAHGHERWGKLLQRSLA